MLPEMREPRQPLTFAVGPVTLLLFLSGSQPLTTVAEGP